MTVAISGVSAAQLLTGDLGAGDLGAAGRPGPRIDVSALVTDAWTGTAGR